jgi:hypothetical protein
MSVAVQNSSTLKQLKTAIIREERFLYLVSACGTRGFLHSTLAFSLMKLASIGVGV